MGGCGQIDQAPPQKSHRGDTSLTFEEMSTLLCQIESCLNLRLLMPISDDPEDLEVLTPFKILIGECSDIRAGAGPS